MVQRLKEQDGNSRKRMIRVVMLVSMVAFLGRVGLSSIQIFTEIGQQPSKAEVERAEVNEQESQLKAQERGYELVLEREPNNQVALEGLVNVRLEMDDVTGAIAPLETLVKLNLDSSEYKQQLDRLKQQVDNR